VYTNLNHRSFKDKCQKGNHRRPTFREILGKGIIILAILINPVIALIKQGDQRKAYGVNSTLSKEAEDGERIVKYFNDVNTGY